MELKKKVREFWNAHPLGSYEISAQIESKEYFEGLSRIRESSSKFVMDFYGFKECEGKMVLDVGCGPGWITVNYARKGANIFSIDLTLNAVKMAKRWLGLEGLKGRIAVGDAEELPFACESFDFVCSDGVLHHTPGTEKGMAEIYRLLKKGGKAVISLYHKNLLLSSPIFPLTKFIMKILGVKTHGVKAMGRVTSEELVRLYDGVDNPLGKAYTKGVWENKLKEVGFIIEGYRFFYFPIRFIPYSRYLPEQIHSIADTFYIR